MPGSHSRAPHALIAAALMFVLHTGAASAVAAQSGPIHRVASLEQQVSGATQMGAVLSKTVLLDVRSQPLGKVLHGLTTAGVPLAYPMDLVQDAGLVSCECRGVTLRTALARLLEGTGIGFREVSAGTVLLFQLPQEPAAAEEVAVGVLQGRVTSSEDGRGISGATVQVLGTGLGVLTRPDGRYMIRNVPAGEHWVRAELIGFAADSQRIDIEDGETVQADFDLEVTAVALDPLDVTVSTGTLIDTEKRALGTSIAVISEEEIEMSGAAGLYDLLQGSAPGVASFQPSGANGSGGFIQIRGVSSVLGDQAPLIYIDGVQVDNGSSGANQAGPDVIPHPSTFSAAHGAGTRLRDLSLDQIERIEIVKGSAATTMYGSEAVNGVIQIFTKRGVAGQTRVTAHTEQGMSRVNLDNTFVGRSPYGEQIRSLFNNPHTQRYGFGLSGGVEDLTYTLGVDHGQDAGVVWGNGAHETSVYGSLTPIAGEKVTLRLSGNFMQRGYESHDYRALFDFADSDGGLVTTNLGIETLEEALEKGSRSETSIDRVVGSANLNWRPLEVLHNQFTVGLDVSDELELRAGMPLRDPYSTDFEAENIRRDFNRASARYVGTLAYPQEGAITSRFSVGASGYRSEIRNLRIRGTGFPSSGMSRLDFAESLTSGPYAPIEQYSAVATVGFFAQEQLGFWDKLFITGGIRADGSSAFGDDFGLQAYPKVSASYVVEPTEWWQGKVRAAWGRSGKLPTPFAKVRTYGIGRGTYYDRPIISVDDYGNQQLKPEVGTEIEVGVENYFFGNRASLEANYWRQTTEDALLRGGLPLIYAFNDPLINIASLRSAGMELAGEVTPLLTDQTRLTFGATLTHMFDNGVITDLGDVEEMDRVGNLFLGLKEGQSLNAITYRSEVSGDRVYHGSRVPTTYGGFNASLRWKDLTVASNASYGFGGVALDYIQTQEDYMNGFLSTPFRTFDPEIAHARYIVPTDYLRLDAVRLMYELPSRFLAGLEQAEVWVEGRNLATWDQWENGDVTTIAPVGTAGGQAPLYLSGTLERNFSSPQHFSLGVRVAF